MDALCQEALDREATETGAKAATFAASDIITISGEIGAGNESAAAFHQFRGFASALVEDTRVANALKESLSKALKEGIGFEEWKKGISEQFDKLGVTEFSDFRLQLIYRTESSLAYGGSQYARLQQVKNRFPFWRYSAILDQRTRPSHRALHGSIFLATDKEFWPPLGFNCRCTVIPISKGEAQRKGITGPTLVTPEMKSNLQNVEFLGDKDASYDDWLKKSQRGMSEATLNLLQQAFEQLLNDLTEAA